MTNYFQSRFIALSDNGKRSVRLNNMGGIYLTAIDHARQGRFGQAGADIGGDVVNRNGVLKRALAAIWQSNNRHAFSWCQWWPLLVATWRFVTGCFH